MGVDYIGNAKQGEQQKALLFKLQSEKSIKVRN